MKHILHLTLVRHTIPAIAEGICYGQTDLDVTENFMEEAKLVRERINERTFDRIVSSPLKRCRKLARACGFENHEIDARISEYNFGEWEMKPWTAINDDYAQKWMDDYFSMPAPGGESLDEMIDRVRDSLTDYRSNVSSRVLLFTHSGPIRVFKYLAGEIAKNELFELNLEFGSVHEVVFEV